MKNARNMLIVVALVPALASAAVAQVKTKDITITSGDEKIKGFLQPPHADATLDLQAVLDKVYDADHYEDYIYSGTPQPPLSADEAEWAQQFVPPLE